MQLKNVEQENQKLVHSTFYSASLPKKMRTKMSKTKALDYKWPLEKNLNKKLFNATYQSLLC